MGCTPSRGEVSDSELLREIELLKSNQTEQAEVITRLRHENEKLRQGLENQGFHVDEGPNHNEDILFKEIEQLKISQTKLEEENETLKKKLVKANGVGTQSPQKPIKQDQPKNKNLPKVGDPVLAMWSSTMWQYFTATIVSFDASELRYTILWDDQDPTGRVVDYYNLALDRVPDHDEVAIGSVVLFPQGKYRGQEGVRLGGMRYHQGRITRVFKDPTTGRTLYDGEHTKGDADGKWVTYSGFNQYFQNLERKDLRISPNVLDILSAQGEDALDGQADDLDDCDVYISYTKTNSPSAIRNREIQPGEMPPSYDEAVLSSMCDPRDIRLQLSNAGVQVNGDMAETSDMMSTVNLINKAKVFIACLSDEYAKDEICRQEFQYAKKTAKKPVIPVVVGSGSFDWQMTVVGLLIAGELYIHFKNKDVQPAKMSELMAAVQRTIPEITAGPENSAATTVDAGVSPQKPVPSAADVFISYCWRNSYNAQQAKQIDACVGSPYADARRIKEAIADKGMSVWLDIHRLRTAGQGDDSMSLFEQIAEGLGKAKVVLVFVSEEYASSEQCRMEFQFALKSLKKPILPVIVGTGAGWESSVVGLLVAQLTERVDLSVVTSDGEFTDKVSLIESTLKSMMGETGTEEARSYKAPVPGDHVVCMHQRSAYFLATIVKFDPATMKYTVEWDDGDPTDRVQSYKDLASDVVPSADQVGVNSRVLFPQGSYGGTEGNNSGGMRWHEGVVTRVYKDANGLTRYDGHHTKGDADGKWVTYRGYDYEFNGLKLDQIRKSPNAMDALMACREAFNLRASQSTVR